MIGPHSRSPWLQQPIQQCLASGEPLGTGPGLTGMWRILDRWVLAVLMAGLSAGALAGSAQVSFVNPGKFSDIGPYGDEREAAQNRSEIARHIEQLAARKLPADQLLEVEVLDVDLAGRFEPWHFWARDVRVMRTVTWPSIKLRYVLKQGEQVLASGEETVADMAYLDHINTYPSSDPLRYDKRMLDRWFQQRLTERKAASR
jgi:hypothetical protein